jgi:hypothetical protein
MNLTEGIKECRQDAALRDPTNLTLSLTQCTCYLWQSITAKVACPKHSKLLHCDNPSALTLQQIFIMACTDDVRPTANIIEHYAAHTTPPVHTMYRRLAKRREQLGKKCAAKA